MKSIRDFVYQHCPYPLQNLLISAYGSHLKNTRYGLRYRQSMEFLQKVNGASFPDVERQQTERLDQFIREAIRHVPYYRQQYRDVLSCAGPIQPDDLRVHFPILEKQCVKARPEEFISDARSVGGRTTVFTSGTTGSPLKVVASKVAVAENFAFFSYFLKKHGLDPFAWSATFAGRLIVPRLQCEPPFWRCNYATRTWLYSSYHIATKTIPAYLAHLKKIQPSYIDSYPSAIYAVARYVVEENVKHSVRPAAIVTSSEVLTRAQRDVIERAFECPVYDQYGSAEMVVFAGQCSKGSYHLHPLYGITEIVTADGKPCRPGEPGDLVLTGLINEAMPLIRYRIGDRAAFRAEPCPCGSPYPALKEVLGRADDFIVTPEGNYVGRLDPLFKGLVGISEAQIIQHDLERIEVLVVPGAGFNDEAKSALIWSLKERVGPKIQITVTRVGSIPRGENGKFRSVISRLTGGSVQ